MNFRLSKFVGRDQLPGDEVAFERINQLFARARAVKPAPKKASVGKRRATKTTAAKTSASLRKAA